MENHKLDKGLSAGLRIFAAVAMATHHVPVSAAFDSDDHIMLSPELNTWYDSNIFRLSDNADTYGEIGSNDKGGFIIQPKINARISQNISRQTIFLDGELFRRTYRGHEDLNFTGSKSSTGANWNIGSQFSGTVKFENKRELSSFEDVSTATRDMSTASSFNNDINWRLTSNWNIIGDSSSLNQKHSNNKELDLNMTSVGGGLQYISDKETTVGYRHDYSRIKYLNDYYIWDKDQRGYNQSSDQFFFHYPLTTKLVTKINFGKVSWDYDNQTSSQESNFGGIVSDWNITEKTQIELSVERQLSSPTQTLDTSMGTTYGGQLNWKPSAKIKYDISSKLLEQSYAGTASRTDKTNIYRVGCEWIPEMNWLIIAYWQKQKRVSDYEVYRYSADTLGVNLKYTF